MEVAEKQQIKTREVTVDPDWCAGCGDFGVLVGLKKATIEKEVSSHNMLVVSGIGCSSNLPGFMYAYGVHSLHGRALPLATGAKLANHNLKVVITGGDGDGYGIGCGHFVHTMRRNFDLTYVVMNNEIYGLTTGQASATSERGLKTKSTPQGNLEDPLNPLALALVSGATFIARAYSGKVPHMIDIIEQGMAHSGFALIDIFSPCVTYHNKYPAFKKSIYKLEDEEPNWDRTDPVKAMAKMQELDDHIPVGIFYQVERPTYDGQEPVLKAGPLVDQPLGLNKDLFNQLLVETM